MAATQHAQREVLGWIAAVASALFMGSFAVPIKSGVVVDLNVDPLVFQTYKTVTCFVTSFAVSAFGIPIRFTLWGLVSGLFWVPAASLTIFAVQSAGLAVGIGTVSSTVVLVSFSWGIAVFREPVRSVNGALTALLCICAGLVGMSYFSSTSTLTPASTSTSTSTSAGGGRNNDRETGIGTVGAVPITDFDELPVRASAAVPSHEQRQDGAPPEGKDNRRNSAPTRLASRSVRRKVRRIADGVSDDDNKSDDDDDDDDDDDNRSTDGIQLQPTSVCDGGYGSTDSRLTDRRGGGVGGGVKDELEGSLRSRRRSLRDWQCSSPRSVARAALIPSSTSGELDTSSSSAHSRTQLLSGRVAFEHMEEQRPEHRPKQRQQQQEASDEESNNNTDHLLFPIIAINSHRQQQQKTTGESGHGKRSLLLLLHMGSRAWGLLTRRQRGILAAVTSGLSVGTMMVPMHYVKSNETRGAGFLVSFGTGALFVNAALWAIRWSCAYYRAAAAVVTNRQPPDPWSAALADLPPFHWDRLWRPAGASAALWSAGNAFTFVSVHYLGESIGQPFLQTSMLISGLWGIYYFQEIKTSDQIRNWLASAVLAVFGIVLLGYEHHAAKAAYE